MRSSEFLELIQKGPEKEAIGALEREPPLAHSISEEEGALEGTMPLHWAVHRNYKLLTTLLVEYGADINAKSCKWGNHSTPLQWAADAGKAETSEILLDHGATIDYHEGNGHTALHCCAWGGSSGGASDPEGYAKTAEVLLKAGFHKDGPGPCVSALTMALHVKNHSVVRVLESVGATHVYDREKIREMMKNW